MTPDEETKDWIIKTAKKELERAAAAKVLDEEEYKLSVKRASNLISSLRRKTRDSGRVSQLGIHDEPKPEEQEPINYTPVGHWLGEMNILSI